MPAILSLGAAIECANTLGMSAIEARVRHLTTYLVTQLNTLAGSQIYGPADCSNRLGLVPFNILGTDPNELVALLEKAGVIIEAGHFMASAIMQYYKIERMARMSLHYFNTEAEIDKTVGLIRDFISRNH